LTFSIFQIEGCNDLTIDNNTIISNDLQIGLDWYPYITTSIIQLTNVGNVTISNSIFDRNYLRGHGAISISYQLDSYDYLNIINSNFTNHIALNVTLPDSSIISSGSAIYAISLSNLLINSSYFYNNSAFQSGGAIFVNHLKSLSIYNSVLEGNEATQGGSIYGDDVGNVNIYGSSVPDLLLNSGYSLSELLEGFLIPEILDGYNYVVTAVPELNIFSSTVPQVSMSIPLQPPVGGSTKNVSVLFSQADTDSVSVKVDNNVVNLQGCLNKSMLLVNISQIEPKDANTNFTIMNYTSQNCMGSPDSDSVMAMITYTDPPKCVIPKTIAQQGTNNYSTSFSVVFHTDPSCVSNIAANNWLQNPIVMAMIIAGGCVVLLVIIFVIILMTVPAVKKRICSAPFSVDRSTREKKKIAVQEKL